MKTNASLALIIIGIAVLIAFAWSPARCTADSAGIQIGGMLVAGCQ